MLSVSVHKKRKKSTETADVKTGSLHQSKNMNQYLLSGQYLDQKTILPPSICFQVMQLWVSAELQVWTKLPSFLTVTVSEKNIYPVYFGLFFLDHWKLPFNFSS